MALLGLSGCGLVGPDYEPPEPDLPAAFVADEPVLAATLPAGVPWWEAFDDEILSRLVEAGVSGSLEVEVARSRVREARSLVRARSGELYPDLDGTASAGLDWEAGGEGANGEPFEAGTDAGLDFLWDADLFGGRRRAVEAARAEAARQMALEEDARVTVASEIARLYVFLRGAQRRFALAEQSVDLQRQTLELVEGRVEAGLAPGLDLSRARGALAGQLAELPAISAEVATASDAIAVLAGEPPGSLSELLAEAAPIPDLQAAPAVGVPRDLLRRRPDIRAAEAQLAGASAEVGVAAAALYPRLTLPGSIGVELSGIASGSVVASVVGSLATVLDIPLFDSGTREATLEAAEERALQALLTYRQTLLEALQQVEAAMVEHAGARLRSRALAEAVTANEAAYDQARSLYAQGLASFLEVLDAQRVLTDSQVDLAEAEVEESTQAIALFRSLGGPPG